MEWTYLYKTPMHTFLTLAPVQRGRLVLKVARWCTMDRMLRTSLNSDQRLHEAACVPSLLDIFPFGRECPEETTHCSAPGMGRPQKKATELGATTFIPVWDSTKRECESDLHVTFTIPAIVRSVKASSV